LITCPLLARLQGKNLPFISIFITAGDPDAFSDLDHMTFETRSGLHSHIVFWLHSRSTDKQGKSGLGLEAQREAIARFAAAESLEVAGEFIEVETGKGADALDKRPQLAAALRRAKQLGAHIAVSKLDRLSRDVHFISKLKPVL
jgi:hypothetical protein